MRITTDVVSSNLDQGEVYTTNVVIVNPAHGEVYSIQHYGDNTNQSFQKHFSKHINNNNTKFSCKNTNDKHINNEKNTNQSCQKTLQ